ncbi:MAG: hypothetical protein P1V36_07245 [Planctomycetota bacterium]|nr:hypothetical protein [Planctomycetota bacterium]
MNALRTLAIVAALLGGLALSACNSSGGGCCSSGDCGCSADRNCCDGCRTGQGCNCNK